MKASVKELGFAVFFLVVIALVAVEAAEASDGEVSRQGRVADMTSERY